MFSYQNLYRQYLYCRKNKRNTYNALCFEARQELNLLELLEALQQRTYQPATSVCFVTTHPKMREIFAAEFRDRVVHHVLVDFLERYWESVFIHDSYACRRGKGIHKAVERLQSFQRRVTRSGKRRAWYLQLDIRNFFMCIDKTILFSLLEPHVKEEDALWLTRLLVFYNCAEDYRLKSRPGLLDSLPEHKSLLKTEPGKGLPIGNLNSQFFANVYLNTLDQFVKHQLKCPFYLRYCDDFVLLSSDKLQLIRWREQIMFFLQDVLRLQLNSRQRLRPISDGVDFLGYIVRPDYRLVRRRVVSNCRAKLANYQRQLVHEQANGYRCYRFDQVTLEQCQATLASYRGHFKQANSYHLVSALWRDFPYLQQYFEFDLETFHLKPLFKIPKGFATVRQQYYYFRWFYPDDVLLFQVGRFYEFYHSADDGYAEMLGLKRMGSNRRGARYGFPVKRIQYVVSSFLNSGLSVLLINEGVTTGEGLKVRRPVCCLSRFPITTK